MAWSWSHAEAAYSFVQQQLSDKADAASDGDAEAADWLCVCWAAWVASDWRDNRVATNLDLHKYERALVRARRQAASLGYGKLATDIWNWASELETCTNGGWEA